MFRVFVAIGHKTEYGTFEGWLDMDENKYLITEARKKFYQY